MWRGNVDGRRCADTKEQCFRRAQQLGVKYNGRKIFGNDYDEWTEDKLQILIDNYPTMGNDTYKLISGATKMSTGTSYLSGIKMCNKKYSQTSYVY